MKYPFSVKQFKDFYLMKSNFLSLSFFKLFSLMLFFVIFFKFLLIPKPEIDKEQTEICGKKHKSTKTTS